MVDLTGFTVRGEPVATDTSEALRAQGSRWADHILEAPISWLLSAVYIFATVMSGYPVVYGAFKLAGVTEDSDLDDNWVRPAAATFRTESRPYR
eukprot:6930532-Pyramimonas_sp.AAC.1